MKNTRPLRKVGDFSNLKGATSKEILEAIPENASSRILRPIDGKVTEGIEYKWVENGVTNRVRIHGPDASAPVGSNARDGWVVRVQKGSKFMDHDGGFHPRGVHNPDSPHYNPKQGMTHISPFKLRTMQVTTANKF